MKKHIPQIIINTVFIIASAFAIIPLILTLIVSFSSTESVLTKGYSFFPSEWSLEAYRLVLADAQVFYSYGVTILVTVVGTIISVLFSAMAAYSMSVHKVKYRNVVALLFYIPTVFSSGLVPWYLVVTNLLHLKDTIWALILPGLISPFNIFLIRNYMKTIPESLSEAAEIDGMGPINTFLRIIFPLSTPIVATVTLFTSLGYWNTWANALWLIDDKKLYPLQYLLYRIQAMINYQAAYGGSGVGGVQQLPSQTIQVATMFITIGPIILVYPFVQKYFIKGIMVGSVKG